MLQLLAFERRLGTALSRRVAAQTCLPCHRRGRWSQREGNMKVLLIGVGGVGEAIAAIARERPWISQLVLADFNRERAAAVQARLVLENDDVRFGVADTLWVHAQTGIRLVFDNLHHRLLNPDNLPPLEALALALATSSLSRSYSYFATIFPLATSILK